MKTYHFSLLVVTLFSCELTNKFAAKESNEVAGKVKYDTALYSVKVNYKSYISGNSSSIDVMTDVELENNANVSRWFVFPDGEPRLVADDLSFSINKLFVERYSEKGNSYLYSFMGSKVNLRAVLLPAHGKMKIDGFPFFSKTDTIKTLSVEVIVASDVSIDGRSVNEWVGKDIPVSEINTEIKYIYSFERKRDEIAYKKSDNVLEEPLQIKREKTLHYEISIK
ncbi:MAG: hypothetical protein ACJ77K_09595 [Bacteroidia bacterium]